MTIIEQQDKQKIREIILAYGFDAVGIAPYGVLHDHKARLDHWLSMGMNADLAYMAKNPRHDPRIVFVDCCSVVVALFAPQCREYHGVLRRSMSALLSLIQSEFPSVKGRVTVDTAPILERAWAVRAGLGAVGRNALLVNERLGSNFNIATLLLNVELPYDEPFERDLCPSDCSLCVTHCPTGAIGEGRMIDCRVCLSYLSQRGVGNGAWGCTECQKVCPLNRGRF